MTAGAAERRSGSGTVYLIHFDQRYKHAGHYMGWAKDLNARITEHLKGQGARLMEVVKDAGITWHVARTWDGDRNRERALKDQHNAPKLCPDCSSHPRPVKAGRAATHGPGTGPHAAGQAPHPVRERSAARQAPLPAPVQVSPFDRGAAQARVYVGRQIDAGMRPEQIAALQQAMFRDYDPQTASPRAREQYQGYQMAAASLLQAHRQPEASPERAGPENTELDDAGMEVG